MFHKYIINYILLAIFTIISASPCYAESWDHIKNSGEYYWGVGYGATAEEADGSAMSNLISNIATHVSADFSQIDDEKSTNGEVSHESRVLYCVKSYSTATLTNAERW